MVAAKRVGAGGNPYRGPSAREATIGFACLLASGENATVLEEIAALRGLQVHEAQAKLTRTALWPWLQVLQRRVHGGEKIAVQCGCDGVMRGEHCHCVVICAHVQQQLDIAEDIAVGPPQDPIRAEPTEAYGLNLEAAATRKWHIGGASIWIGVGQSATILVTWVPQAKAALLLVDICEVFGGCFAVAAYRSFVHALQDTVRATGGGQYRMKGLFDPLREDAELGEGPETHVWVRKQMGARLRRWQSVLSNRPGASMLTAVGPSPLAESDIVWEIGGDAASERLR